jgi:LPXTG-motif cell wall-anchored protein
MHKHLKFALLIAGMTGLMVMLLPPQIAWAGLPYQTVPTAGPSRTPTSLPATPTAVVNTQAPTNPPAPATSVPLQPQASSTSQPFTATAVIQSPVATKTQTPMSAVTLSPVSTTTGEATALPPSPQPTLSTGPTEPPGFVPTDSAKTPGVPSFNAAASVSPTPDPQISGSNSNNGFLIFGVLAAAVLVGIVVLNRKRKV